MYARYPPNQHRWGAGSPDHGKTLGKCLCLYVVWQGFSWPLVQLSRDCAEFGLTVGRHINASREVLAQKTVGAFVAAAWPGVIAKYKAAGIPAPDVRVQSFNRDDALYRIENEPEFGKQTV